MICTLITTKPLLKSSPDLLFLQREYSPALRGKGQKKVLSSSDWEGDVQGRRLGRQGAQEEEDVICIFVRHWSLKKCTSQEYTGPGGQWLRPPLQWHEFDPWVGEPCAKQQGQNKQKTPLFNEKIFPSPIKILCYKKGKAIKTCFWLCPFDYYRDPVRCLGPLVSKTMKCNSSQTPQAGQKQLLGCAARCPADTRQCYSRAQRAVCALTGPLGVF